MWSYVCFLELLHHAWWTKPMMFGVQTQGFEHQFHQNWGQNEKWGWNLYIKKETMDQTSFVA